eukprot:13109280-Ditylum_brightwellii.AAC.1
MIYSLNISTYIQINVDKIPTRLKKGNLSDDVNKTNTLRKKDNKEYKLDNKIDGGDNSNDDYVE